MKKKIVLLMMTLTMISSTLAGCGNEYEEPANTSPISIAQEAGESTAQNTSNQSSARKSMSNACETTDSVCDEACSEADSSVCMDSGYSLGADYCEEYYPEEEFNTEEYSEIKENGFSDVSLSPLSTFSADVDTASYANLRRFIMDGYRAEEIPSGAIRIEEMLNYFDYDYNLPKGDEPFGVTATISDCPWNEDSKLCVLGMQTEEIDFSEAKDSNIVFLIDVSGSMYDENKLPLLIESFEMLVDNLTEKDKVSIVTYAGEDSIVIEGVPASEKKTICDALEGLEAGGGTNGGQGIISAYDLAEEYFIEDGNNRVILATDGDFNIGLSNQSDLKDLITEKKETGVYLSVLGFGMGNYSDSNMETLADAGNGNYAYIDSLSEAKKVLVKELSANMSTVAEDVKFQVEFNPAVVSEYRLIGYEDRALANEDFEDDKKDAGEIGAGHSVTVMYEIKTADSGNKDKKDLKYQKSELTDEAYGDEWFTLAVRYKEPGKSKSKLLEYPIGDDEFTKNPSDDFKFASAVAEFGMLMRGSEYVDSVSYKDILSELNDIDLNDEYKEEFYDLVDRARLND